MGGTIVSSHSLRGARLGWLLCLLLAGSAWAGAPGPPEEPAFPESAREETAAPTELPVASTPAPTAPDPRLDWRSLRYKGSAVLGEFDATLTLEPASGARSWVAQLHTRMRSRLLPDNQATVRAWFDPATAIVTRFEKLSLGGEPNFKRFHFQEGGVQRFRKEPVRGEDVRRPETWKSERESFVSFDAASHGCRLISDPGVLVYLVSSGPGGWEEDPAACVVSGKTLYRVSVLERASDSQELRYRVQGGDTPLRAGRVPVTRYEVIGQPVAGEVDEAVTRMDLLVDAETQLPWKVVVREGPFRVDVQLSDVVLRTP